VELKADGVAQPNDAGPNGSGKTTATERGLAHEGFGNQSRIARLGAGDRR
jgi:hypothetical protein